MAFGLQVYDRDENLLMDTSSKSWMQVAVLNIPSGDTGSTIYFSGSSLPAGMELRVALQIISDVAVDEKQLVPSVSINQSTRVVIVTSTSGTTTNAETNTFNAYSAACKILILGR